jgi:hypothetical protein
MGMWISCNSLGEPVPTAPRTRQMRRSIPGVPNDGNRHSACHYNCWRTSLQGTNPSRSAERRFNSSKRSGSAIDEPTSSSGTVSKSCAANQSRSCSGSFKAASRIKFEAGCMSEFVSGRDVLCVEQPAALVYYAIVKRICRLAQSLYTRVPSSLTTGLAMSSVCSCT